MSTAFEIKTKDFYLTIFPFARRKRLCLGKGVVKSDLYNGGVQSVVFNYEMSYTVNGIVPSGTPLLLNLKYKFKKKKKRFQRFLQFLKFNG